MAAGLMMSIAGCGGSGSPPSEPTQITEDADSATVVSPTPPGGMELPSNLDVSEALNVSDAPAASPETGASSFELPE